jgi:prepilin-type N-terminal cleavage/methylation domain-containing protein
MKRKPAVIASPWRARGGIVFNRRNNTSGFTLAELLVSVFVLAIIVLMVSQLMNNAAAITKIGHKHITTDTQARTVFDRMAVDFAQMLKRTDVDYYVKGTLVYNQHGHGNGHGWGNRRGAGQQGSDQIGFFSQVPGYNSTGYSWQSPLSLVAYRINQNSNTTNPDYLKLQRMGKGLLWNGVDTRTNTQATYPIVFLDQTISGTWPPAVNNTNTCGGGSTNNSCDPDYETIGPGVFRLEYYYLLKNGKLTDVPWDQEARPNQTSLTSPQKIGLADVESITVAIAVIDPAGRALIDAANSGSLDDLASDMPDFRSSHGRGVGGTKNIGDLEADWNAVLVGDGTDGYPGVISTGRTSAGTPIPPEAAKGIRIYSKTFDLRTL